MPITKVEYASTIPAGTNIVALWPVGTALPKQSVLDETAANFGEPFTLAYLNYSHEGVSISQGTKALDVYQAFATAAAGNAPLIVALDPADEAMVDLELKAKYFKSQVKKLSDGTIDLMTPPLLPDSGVLRGVIYVAAGVVILGGAYYVYKRFFKKGRRK